ncbi:putative ABC transport system ATP-binding protein [Prosthecobacter debontii]|uniref:Putative ABC transport system ATP-binding protein n=1 Tax=Prosthecobacter debontii TaxID=48467 RepID=A0A1T4XGA8_9BACT|nr:ATP-binding cassette domain-containing protein [Prosthecobacter debontii]SKA88539.1 putative ABC transport system ATP-binding protein [Prosthecobacter debontii]
MLALRDIQFRYPASDFQLAVKHLEVRAGEPLAILGPSGGGKTTILRLMTGLLSPDHGSVSCGDTQFSQLTATERRRFRLEKIGLVFQDFALLDYLTVEENILLPSQFQPDDPTLRERANGLAEQLEIAPHWHRLTGRLSQGERQRVAIARALVHRPAFVFADEPTASLDVRRRGVVMDLLLNYAREQQACLVVVTHDPELMPLFAQQLRVEDLTAA